MIIWIIMKCVSPKLIGFVVKNAQKDGVGKFSPEDITFIVQGELEYCDSINMFD